MMLACPILPPVSVPLAHAKFVIFSVAVMLLPAAPAVFAVIVTLPPPVVLAVIPVDPTFALKAVTMFCAICVAVRAAPLAVVIGTYWFPV